MPTIFYDWEILEDHDTQRFFAEVFDDDTKETVYTTPQYLYAHTAERVAMQYIDKLIHHKEDIQP